MPRRPLTWPFAGRADDSAHSDQPGLTTRSARNVRNRDPVTGKIRGATRSGLLKFNPDPIGVGRVKALVSTAFDTRKVAFSFSTGAVTTAWDQITPSKTDSLAGRTDKDGNVYALDGNAGIVKYNSAGREIMKIALPVLDAAHVVRALFVDDALRIFAAVSAGGDVRTARVFCVLQLQENQSFVLWTLEPGAYTEDLAVFNGSQLYAAHNYTLENRARVLVYEGLGLTPFEAKRIESVAYPVNAMALGSQGNVYCASEEGVEAGTDGFLREGFPGQQRLHAPIEGWTIFDLPDVHKRLWSYYDADALDETDVEQTGDVAELVEGQRILRWRDLSGNNRHWYANIATNENGPTLRLRGIGGLKTIYFDQSGSTLQSLVTLGNASMEKSVASQQRTAIPSYVGSMWAMFILIRPTQETVTVGAAPRVVFFADNQHATASDHALWINRACQAAQPGVFASGDVSYFATTDVAPDDGQCGAADQALGKDYTSDAQSTGCTLITILWDGGVDPADMTKTRCLFRVNGNPIDRFEGLPYQSLLANYLGFATGVGTAAANRYQGEIASIVVLDRKDRFDDSTEPKVLTHDQLETGSTSIHQTDTEICRIEAWMLYRRGLAPLLPERKNGALPPNRFGHFYGFDVATSLFRGPPAPTVGGLSTAFAQIIHNFPLVSKHDAQGVLKWVCNESTHPDTGANRGGIGYGVATRKVESDGKVHVWMSGPPSANVTPGGVDVRKVIDNGDSFSGASADGAWRHTFSGGTSLDYANPKLAADAFGNLFLPGHDVLASIRGLTIFAKDGAAGLAVVRHTEILPGSSDLAYAVALPPDGANPDYRGDLALELAEFVYVFTKTASAGSENAVYKLRLVNTAATTDGNPEEVVTLAVTEDDIRKITETTNVVPSGGSGVIDASAQFVQALRAGEDIVVLDGKRVFAYSLRDGTVAQLESTSAGEVPTLVRYAMFWRHRLVLALDGGKYSASRLGNIRDWNLNPGSNIAGVPLQTSTQAFNGTLTRAGESEDSIVTMIPVWDDLAFLVGKSRILRLTGDPQDGGNIHKVTESMGGVFGDSWCIDKAGRVFMWGNKPPGLYQLQPTGDPVPLSERTLEASEFEDIDFSTHRIVLAWDAVERTVRIFQVAWADSTIVAHWAWEEATHRLVRSPPVWQDRINSAAKQPTAVTYLAGDDTRGLLIGCADGYVRRFDKDARDDDGTAIDSFVLMELTGGVPEGQAVRVREFSIVLADDQEGCRLEVFAGDTADSIGPILEAFDLSPGRNSIHVRTKGARLWARLRNAATGRWAYEQGSVDIVPAGRIRVR